MTSVAAKRRNRKKRAVQRQVNQQAPGAPKSQTSRPSAHYSTSPTPERLSRGVWAKPTGAGKESKPMVDITADLIGQLYHAGKITSAQEQAARSFDELRTAYLKELGTRGYGSCLADNQQGHDDSDGNPEVIAAYNALRSRIGRAKIACLVLLTEGTRVEITALRRALDEVVR